MISTASRPAGSPCPQISRSARLWRGATVAFRGPVVGWGIAGGLLYWASLPPLQWSPLGFFALAPWIWLARRRTLPGSGPYRQLWLAGFFFWLLTIYWLTLPHWAAFFGYLALSAYLACYLPAFVALVRLAVHRLRVPLAVAAPVVWTGLELVRAHLLTGFLMAALSHTQYRFLALIQASDLGGAYAVSFVLAFTAACAARLAPCDEAGWSWRPIIPAALLVGSVLAYGHYRLANAAVRPGPRIALIQGSIDIELKADPGQAQTIFDHYFDLSRQAVQREEKLDLIVWPETMFRVAWFLFDHDYQHPADAAWTREEALAVSRNSVTNTVRALRTPMLLGIDTVRYARDRMYRFNSALFADRDGVILDRYDKLHLVMFGEYVPFAEWFPWLYRLTPLSLGLDPGDRPRSVEIGGFRYAPNICYESTTPHLIGEQMRRLAAEKNEPDVLVNLTNDGWFWGSSELDLHLICGVFRAVECRKPLVIAANTGFSASIDGDGRVRDQGPRRAPATLVCEVELDGRQSIYSKWGDVFAGACLAISALWGISGMAKKRGK